MKNFKIYFLLIFTIAFYSCNSKVKSSFEDENNLLENQILLENSSTVSKKEAKFMDTINISFNDHKTLLNILKILPESTMDSWEWSEKDRVKTVNFIEKNNYLIDSTKMYKNIKYIKPNTVGIQVVDGFWTLSIYQFTSNHYFIVTNDIVGDGNDIQTFNYINNELKPLKMVNWFDGFDYKLLVNNSQKCIDLLEDNALTYNYNFTDKNTIEISSWLINKKESENCFKGNSIKYKLNKETKTFDIVDVFWKNNKVKTITPQDSGNLHIQAKINAFVENLKKGESVSKHLSKNWTLVYHEDNRCDGSTDGKINNLSNTQVDAIIKVKVINDGDAWACDKKDPKNYVFDFSLKKQIENWDRFEIADYETQEKNIKYVLGAGESDYLKLYYNNDNKIERLEYRSEDPG